MKRLSITLALILALTLPVAADLSAQIAQCQANKAAAHDMAEAARALGYAEDHVIIQEAKARWEAENKLEKELTAQANEAPEKWTGPVLTKAGGVNYGPSGMETYYNLPMGGVVQILRTMGYDEDLFPYWVREDGVKMFGKYVMAAGNLDFYYRGQIVECSLGEAIVCDTGYLDAGHLDIAVAW